MPNDDKKAIKIWTRKLAGTQIAALRELVLSCGDASEFRVDYADWAFKLLAKKVNVVAYSSGKIVINGAGTQDFVVDFVEPKILGKAEIGYEKVNHPDWFERHAGLDESGKGDLFGPICTACVIADGNAVQRWLDAGVRDSKKIADSQILKLEQLIRSTAGTIVRVGKAQTLARYNELYAAHGLHSLNQMLASFHAKTLLAALADCGGNAPAWGLLDQFCSEPLVQNYLARAGTRFELRMRTHAESDPIVAAASICARAAYVKFVRALEAECGFELPKGCGNDAKLAGTRILRELGRERLGDFCKLHFKTVAEL